MKSQYFWAGSPSLGDGKELSINNKSHFRAPDGSYGIASTDLYEVGFQINTVGVVGNFGIDLYDAKYKAGFFRIGKHVAFAGLGKALKYFGGFDEYFIKPLEFHMNQAIDSMISPQSTLTPINYQLDKNYNIKY